MGVRPVHQAEMDDLVLIGCKSPSRHLSKTGRLFDSCNRSRSRINWYLVLSAEHTSSLYMIRMFMCDQNSIEFVPFNLQLIQTFFNSFLTNCRYQSEDGNYHFLHRYSFHCCRLQYCTFSFVQSISYLSLCCFKVSTIINYNCACLSKYFFYRL